MGHADITTTMNIYAEATKEKKQQAMANPAAMRTEHLGGKPRCRISFAIAASVSR